MVDSSVLLTPVFVDTNLGTRIVVPVSPDITAKEFKGELERLHLSCFPEVGNIRVKALLVERNSRYYHLSESLPLKYIFQGSNGTWFLHTEVHKHRIANQINPSEPEVVNCNSTDDVIDSIKFKKKRKKKRANTEYRNGYREQAFPQCPLTDEGKIGNSTRIENFNGTLSESVSVSGIIKKYFSDCDDVASSPSFPHATMRNKHNERVKRTYEDSGEKRKKPEVGKRLLLASDNLGLIPSHQKPELSLCKFNNGRSPFCESSDIVRSLVFEI